MHRVLVFILTISAMIVDVVMDVTVFLLFRLRVWSSTAPTDRTGNQALVGCTTPVVVLTTVTMPT